MNEKWTDFEKFVFKELGSISKRLSRLEGKAITWGAIAGLIVSVVAETVSKHIK